MTLKLDTVRRTAACLCLVAAGLLLLMKLLATVVGGDTANAGPPLSEDDKTICYHSARGEATSVLYATGAGDSDELVELASAIVVGSSDEEDEETMRRVDVWCRDHGYDLEISAGRR